MTQEQTGGCNRSGVISYARDFDESDISADTIPLAEMREQV